MQRVLAISWAIVLPALSQALAAWEPLEGEPDSRFLPISFEMNNDAIASNAQPRDGDFYDGYAFPLEELPPSGSMILVNGVPFRFPEIADGKPNNFFGDLLTRDNCGKAYNETKRLAKARGYFSAVHFLASSNGPGRNELGLVLCVRDFATAWVPRWDQWRPRGGSAPAIEVNSMFHNGERKKRKGTIWLVTIPLNPNVFGAPNFSLAPMHFPERVIENDTHIFAVTLERSPVYLDVTDFKGGLLTSPDFPTATVRVVSATDEPQSVTLRWELTDIDHLSPVRKPAGGYPKIELPAGGSETRRLEFNPGRKGYFRVEIWLADKKGKCLTRWDRRVGILPPLENKANLHVKADSGPVEGLATRLFDRKVCDLTAGRVNGEAELNYHDPAEYAIEPKKVRAQNPGKSILCFGASGPAFQWWERMIENGAWPCLDALWIEPVITPRAPESESGYWKVSSIAQWRRLLAKYGHKTLVARLNPQGSPRSEPGLGIVWADQGVEDCLLGKWVSRACVMLATECEHIALSDSWGRPYQARWWEAWGMADDKGPFARAVTGPATLEQLNGAAFKAAADLGPGNYGYLFERAGERILVAWTAQITPQKVAIPVAGTVRLLDVWTNESKPEVKDGKLELLLTDLPQFIYGVADVRLVGEPQVERAALLRKKGEQAKTCMAIYPSKGIEADHRRVIVKAAPGETIEAPFLLRVYNYSAQPATGEIELSVPEGWKADPPRIRANVPPCKTEESTDPKTNQKTVKIVHDHEDYPFTVTVSPDAKEVENRIFAEGTLDGQPTERVSYDYIWVVDPKKPAPARPRIAFRGSSSAPGTSWRWDEVPPFTLSHWALPGNEPGRAYFQNNYIYHFAKPSFKGRAMFAYDLDNFYVHLDIEDPFVATELPALYSYSGILDHADLHIVSVRKLAADKKDEGFFSFLLIPSGPKEWPYAGGAADPFPVIRDATMRNEQNQMGDHPMNDVQVAVLPRQDPPGYTAAVAFPLRFINATAETLKEVRLQIETLDADETMLYYYNWFDEKTGLAAADPCVRNQVRKERRSSFSIFKNPGDYSAYKLEGRPQSCGLVGPLGRAMAVLDDPAAFSVANHAEAETVFFSGAGYFEYEIDIGEVADALARHEIASVVIGAEVSSEFPSGERFCYVWPSEITFWLNGIEAKTFLAPGDVVSGWWVEFAVNPVEFKIRPGRPLRLRIGVKDTAARKNGLNIYGDRTGKHGRDISVTFLYGAK